MNTEIATLPEIHPGVLADIVLAGDLSKLKPAEKVEYYIAFCARVGLDPATQPFAILKLNGKEKLYCDRGGCAQLNAKHHVTHKIVAREIVNECYVVTAQASKPDGRATESIGAVPIKGMAGEGLCNAMMKAETKAKRRSTLDLLGLGMLDESEVASIPGSSKLDLSAAAGGGSVSTDMASSPSPANSGAGASGGPSAADHFELVEEHASDFRETRIHFGRHRGLMLAELTPPQVGWLENDWMPRKEVNGPTSVEDLALINALKAYRQWRGSGSLGNKPKGGQASVTVGENKNAVPQGEE